MFAGETYLCPGCGKAVYFGESSESKLFRYLRTFRNVCRWLVCVSVYGFVLLYMCSIRSDHSEILRGIARVQVSQSVKTNVLK